MLAKTETEEDAGQDILRLSTEIVAAYVSRNTLQANAIGEVVRSVHGALTGLNQPVHAPPAQKQKPAVPIARSIQPDFIVCLEDGTRLKMLKRYLRSRYDMSPEEYRRKWGLGAEYPMVAPNYAARRSDFAKKIGLGRGVRRKRAKA